jgi:hypothetical protein
MKMFHKLPDKAKIELVFDYPNNPMTLNVVAMEVQYRTKLSKRILERLGYKDERVESFESTNTKRTE